MQGLKIVVAMCGSFCTFEQVMPQIQSLVEKGANILPMMSQNAAQMDTKFGKAENWKNTLEEITGKKILQTIQQAEPLGPKNLADLMVIAPCTGNTMAKLSAGITDGCVTMAAKSMLRGGKPVVIALSTNDGLAAAARNIGDLLNRKQYYFVPFGQDDYKQKPRSLQADFEKLEQTIQMALQGIQIQPVLFQK